MPVQPAAVPGPASAALHHTVRKGETVFSIARRYGVSVEELRKWNGLRGSTVRPGQRLWVSPRN
jgi:LysM repeat protein